MLEYLKTNSPNEHKAGRDSAYSIPDMLDKGEHLLFNIAGKSEVMEDDSVDQSIEEDDSLRSDPPIGTGLPDPDRQMCRQTSVLTLAHPSAHPC
jgi:hypothetical protein